ncbi:efflux RND transporter periplasmic adaptor subunit [Frateuria aurantia]
MNKRGMIAVAAMAAIAGSWAVLGGHGTHAQTPVAGQAPQEVTVARPLSRPLANIEHFTGSLQAVDQVQLRPRISGYVDAVLFKEGARVQRGQLLYQIDPRPYQAEVDRLSASAAQARAELALAQSNAARAERLLAQHAVGQADADQQRTAALSARATLAATEAALTAARLNLDFTQIRAPIDGQISNAQIQAGNLVTPDTVLTSVVTINPIYAYFDIDEHSWLQISRLLGQHQDHLQVALGLADEAGYPHPGHIDFIDNQLQRNTGTIRLRAVFDNADGSYKPGLYARLALSWGAPEPRLLIEDRAVGTDQDNQFVYVVDGKHQIQYRRIQTGRLVDPLREVLSGLKPGDEVVVNGLQHVQPGQTVTPVAEAPSLATGTGPAASQPLASTR